MKNKFFSLLISFFYLTSCSNSSDHITQVDKSTITKDTSWYKYKFQALCDEENGVFLDIRKEKKYGKYYPYDTVQIATKDSTTISFEFITDCCWEFSGDVALDNDSLILYYFTNDGAPCDCYCDYRMTYKLNTKDKHWKGIKIIQGKPQIAENN